MTLGALALIVAATLAIDAAVEHGPERWAAWQRRREAAKRAERERMRADFEALAWHWRPAPPAAIGRRRD